MSDVDVSIEAKDSAFFNESSLTDPFGIKNSVKDLSHELSEILRGREDASGENQLDQCVLEEPGEDREDAGRDITDMLKDVMEEDRLDDDLGKVHRFTKPILSESDLEEQKEPQSKGKASVKTDDTRGVRNVSSAEAPSVVSGYSVGKVRQESTGEVLIEGEERRSSLCQGCLPPASLLQAYCSLF